MRPDEPWQRLLREALAVLALPPEQQARVNGPGCVACDLLNDFDHARLVAVGNAKDLSEKQRDLLGQIDVTMRAMEPPDFECFDHGVLRRPIWQQLRERAAEALRELGWEGAEVQPFVEIEPGVWRRPASDASPLSYIVKAREEQPPT